MNEIIVFVFDIEGFQTSCICICVRTKTPLPDLCFLCWSTAVAGSPLRFQVGFSLESSVVRSWPLQCSLARSVVRYFSVAIWPVKSARLIESCLPLKFFLGSSIAGHLPQRFSLQPNWIVEYLEMMLGSVRMT